MTSKGGHIRSLLDFGWQNFNQPNRIDEAETALLEAAKLAPQSASSLIEL